MKFPVRPRREYEKVPVEVWINGEIEEVQYKDDHENFNKEKVQGVRLKLKLEGCSYPHYTRWMTFGCAEKSNLYKLVILPLVQDAKPFMDFDMDELTGFKIKSMWSNNDEYQNLDMMRPINGKLVPSGAGEPPEEVEPDEAVIPF